MRAYARMHTISYFICRLALDGGSDGLDVIRIILERACLWRASTSSAVFMEVDTSHTQAVLDVVTAPLGLRVKTFKDVFGRNRFMRAT